MSITTCKYCDNQIDEDFDVEHEEVCKQENMENINITLGRLRGLIKYHTDTAKTCRMLDLLEIISEHIDRTDLALKPHSQDDSLHDKLDQILKELETIQIQTIR